MGILLSGNIFKTGRGALLFPAMALIALLLTGCATTDESVNFLYQPTTFGRGGSGDLYLARGNQPAAGKEKSSELTIGEIKNGSGEIKGHIISVRSPEDIVTDAFSREFKAAGYNVIPVQGLPANVGKGIRLESVTVQLDEVKGLVKLETVCTVKVKLEPWRNGVAIKKLNYENTYTASTVAGRDLFLLQSLQSTMQELMARVVREVTVVLEKQ
ncbi:MAG TPA: hypothetical protein VMJ66_12300 [Geobacteraceae bacterium]|nr:hypothetical protein [Geobacteraceae bacterium]